MQVMALLTDSRRLRQIDRGVELARVLIAQSSLADPEAAALLLTRISAFWI